MSPLTKINQLSESEFVTLLGSIYEHSEWVARSVLPQRPFPSRSSLLEAMREVVESSSREAKLKLIRAHPDLGGKLAQAGKLTEDSTKEQAGLGLDRLSPAEFSEFTQLNTSYQQRFGFPFIICAKLHTREGVLAAFKARLGHAAEEEEQEALRQIHLIAQLRVEEKVADSAE